MGGSRRRAPGSAPTQQGEAPTAPRARRPRRPAGSLAPLLPGSELLDRIDDLVCVHDLDGNIRWANAASVRALGWSLEELTRKNLAEILAPVGLAKLGAYLEAIRRDGRAEGTMRVVTRVGEQRHWEFRNALHAEDGAAPLVYGVARDITERELDEERRRVIGTRLRLALEASNVGLWDWDLITDRVHFSREWKRQIGYQDDELAHEIAEWRNRCHPDDVERVVASLAAYRREPVGQHEIEFRFRHRDGRWLWILSRAEILRDDSGAPVRMLGCHVDVTERKRAEQALAASEDRYRDLVEHGQELICTHDLDGRLLSLNPWAARALGRPIEELTRMNVRDVLAPEHRHEFETYLAALRRDGVAEGLMVVETASGERRIWEYRNTVRTEGVPRLVVRGMAHDVTERVRAERELRKSEEILRHSQDQFRSLVEQAPIAIAMLDREMRYLVASRRWGVEYGRGFTDLVGRSHYEVHPDLPERWKEVHRRALAGETLRNDDDLWVQADGTRNWLRWAALPWRDARGEIGGIILSAEDITERKRAEEALAESERKSRSLTESLHELVYRADPETLGTMFVNRAVEAIYGYTAEEWLADTGLWHRTLHPDDAARVSAAFEAARSTASSAAIEYRIVRRDGRESWVIDRFSWERDGDGRLRALVGVLSDITDRKRAEQELRASEERFAGFMRTMPLIAFIKDVDGRLLYINEAFEKSFDIALAECRGKTDAELWPPETARQLRANDLEILASGEPVVVEETVERPDGLQTWMSYKFPFRDAAGRSYLAGTAVNITERKRVEEALRESEEKFAKAFRSQPAIVLLTTLDGAIVDANQAYLDLAGRGREEVLGKTVTELGLISAEERHRAVELIERNGGTLRNVEHTFRLSDGSVREMLISVEPIQLGGVLHRLTTLLDITERRRAEEAVRGVPRRLLAAQEEERRRIARELHDELGQILTAAKLNLQALSRQEAPVAAVNLAPALVSLERALAATRDLSLELRPSILDDLGLVPALRWQLDRVGRDADLAVHFATNLDDERFASELETACFRIAQEALTNVARHAAAREAWVEVAREDGWLGLSVRDDGRGFDVAAMTARGIAGQSLGLLGMRERASLAGGELEIRSRPGAGTEVHARVPAFLAEAPGWIAGESAP